MRITISVIKADVGSIGGHTRPSERMLDTVRARLREAVQSKLVLDGLITYTGDDIAIIMSHTRGVGARDIHRFAWDSFLAATDDARVAGLYGAGQDLLVDAPSGNVRGARARPSPRSNSTATRRAATGRPSRSSCSPPTSAARAPTTIRSTPSSATRCTTAGSS